MKKSLIPFAGIFLACILCAGIPAVAAAENTNPSLNPGTTVKPAETPQPWYTPISDLFGMHQQAGNPGQQDTTGKDSVQPVNTASGQSGTEKAWWEKLMPSEWTKETPEQGTASQAKTQNTAAPVTTPDPAPVTAQETTPAYPATPSPSAPSNTENPQKPQNSPPQKTP